MYAKIFTQIFDSTIADDCDVRHVFMDFLLLADKEGVVNMTLPAISRRTNVPIETLKRVVAFLEAPDMESRTPDHEGRRLLRLDNRDWGWQIVNYSKYRDIATEDHRRTIQNERTRRFRENGGGHYQKWPATRARVLIRDNNLCGYCGEPADCVDHIIPKASGGSDDDSNLIAACTPCNSKKNNRTPEEAGISIRNHRVTHEVTPIYTYTSASASAQEREYEGKPPSKEAVKLQAAKMGLPEVEAEKFWCFYESKGWIVGKGKMKKWVMAMAGWKVRWQEKVCQQRELNSHSNTSLEMQIAKDAVRQAMRGTL